LTWLWLALINVGLAIVTSVSSDALTCVGGDAVNTSGSVLARVQSALIDVGFTVVSSVSRFALTCV
jgi:hypothetical protein